MEDISGFRCSICGKEIKGLGNDPRPIKENKNDSCCDACYSNFVWPARQLIKYLETVAKANEVVLRFDGFYLGIKRRFGCWEYWVTADNEDFSRVGVYDDDNAPMTKVIKDLMEKHDIPFSGFEPLVPDPYEMLDYMYE